MCSGERFSCFISLIVSLLLGILGGILFFLGIVENVTIALIVSLIITALISIFLFVLIIIPNYNSCILNSSCCIPIGIMGVLIFGIIALSIDLEASVVNSFIIGAVIFFLSLMLIKFFSLIECVIRSNQKSCSCINNYSWNRDCNCNGDFSNNSIL